MKPLDCTAVNETAADFTLGFLTGEQRAATIAHLDQCPRCRSDVAELAVTADSTLLLVPGAEPPDGFDRRTVHAFISTCRPTPDTAHSPTAPRRQRRLAHSLVAACVIVALVAVVFGSVVVSRGSAAASVALAVRAQDGREIGHAVVTSDEPAWLFMTLDPAWVSGAYECRVALRDGSVIVAGEFVGGDGPADWSGRLSVSRGQMNEIRVVDPDGHLIGSATLP
jgi:hypothetical protein